MVFINIIFIFYLLNINEVKYEHNYNIQHSIINRDKSIVLAINNRSTNRIIMKDWIGGNNNIRKKKLVKDEYLDYINSIRLKQEVCWINFIYHNLLNAIDIIERIKIYQQTKYDNGYVVKYDNFKKMDFIGMIINNIYKIVKYKIYVLYKYICLLRYLYKGCINLREKTTEDI
ncbi:hypothetical protein SLOPH_551 [Spraguea lophii 42_110]|uniref:Uncharacterized protein n=1 Tax=Spraguea lophii (strain 42_110) TaxID=1358809 RepID=S7XPZ3_SPRLO|nr:hypothetical protein SLOPH_551 [Spraguea lophii 42_110]